MTRTLLPATFTNNRKPSEINNYKQSVINSGKEWLHGINTIEKINKIPAEVKGFELDVYFDTTVKAFHVYHDSSVTNRPPLDTLLSIYRQRRLNASIWFDVKNLNPRNADMCLMTMQQIRTRYSLHNRMLIESPAAKELNKFSKEGFYTLYYTPFFNPYLLSDAKLVVIVDSIENQMRLYPASALSGYYFQYPFLKHYFPRFPVLTWTADDRLSLVSKIFQFKLRKDSRVAVYLVPAI